MKWILILLIVSCANSPVKLIEEVKEPVRVDVKKIDVYNGKVKFVEFEIPKGVEKKSITCKEIKQVEPLIKEIPYHRNGDRGYLYYAENYHSKSISHECFLEDYKILDITVKQYPYKEEFLKVARGKVVLSKKNKERAAKEWHMTQKLYNNSHPTSLINEPYKVPLNSFITSHYGKRRVFNNLKKTQHLGNDFRARVGVKIPVSNRGKVVYVGNLFYTGNVVIVDHGLGIFSLYAHLSKFRVKNGDMVEKGQIVGLSGRTGRVSGPHLHWGVKVHGFNIDGFSLVEESKKQFMKNELIK